MNIRWMGFKWYTDRPIEAIAPIFPAMAFTQPELHRWTRFYQDHTLEIQYRERMGPNERSYFWLYWKHPQQVDTAIGQRVLTRWYMEITESMPLCVYWMQSSVDVRDVSEVSSYQRNNCIWSREAKGMRYSLYPMRVYDTYYFEVRSLRKEKAIPFLYCEQWFHDLNQHIQYPPRQATFDVG